MSDERTRIWLIALAATGLASFGIIIGTIYFGFTFREELYGQIYGYLSIAAFALLFLFSVILTASESPHASAGWTLFFGSLACCVLMALSLPAITA
jgi:hypothetical protein